jgi:hypothetical protein
MKTFQIFAFAAMTALAQGAFAEASTACATDGYGPMSYQIYVDPPSGDTFIRTPCGWRFIRTVEPARITEAIRMSRIQPADLERDDGAGDRMARGQPASLKHKHSAASRDGR